MPERKRYFLSFDMENPRHREAEALVAKQGSRQRTDFVVSSILTANQAEMLEQLVRQAVRDELKSLRLSTPPQPEPEVELSELPDSLINALKEL
jgi:hypothetical protein